MAIETSPFPSSIRRGPLAAALIVLAIVAGTLAAAAQGTFRAPFQPNLPPAAMAPGPRIPSTGRIIVPTYPTTPGANCRPSCATHCANVDCDGVSRSRCLARQQNCRVACVTRC